MTFVTKLVSQLDELRERFVLEIADRAQVVRSFQFLYGTVLATVPLLIRAAEMVQPTDVFQAALKDYFQRHAEEERMHEVWFAEDLRESGVTIGERDWLAAAAAGSQYYAIAHQHPAALLGYLAFLETSPMPEPAVAALEELHGKTLMRTLRIHATSDLEHRIELFALLERVPEPLQELVESSALVTAHYWLASNERVRTGAGAITYL